MRMRKISQVSKNPIWTLTNDVEDIVVLHNKEELIETYNLIQAELKSLGVLEK